MPTIQEAILLMGPRNYWPLNTGDSSGALDLGLGDKPMTISGSVDLEMPGPEQETAALRLYSGGQAITSALNRTSFGQFTAMFWASAPANALPVSVTPIMNLGDAANRLVRGWWAGQSSSGVNNLAWQFRGSTAGPQAAVAIPQMGWHHEAWTYEPTGTVQKIYIDGATPAPTNLTPGLAPQTADPLLIKSDAPVIVSHVAIWDRVLTQAEIQSVSSLRVPWPFDLPINTQPSTGEGASEDLEAIEARLAALEASQTAQSTTIDATKTMVEEIKGYWNGYSSTTLPSLNAKLNTIDLAVRGTVETATGVIAKTVGELLSNVPLSLAGDFPVSGGEVCGYFEQDLSLASLYGISLLITQYPENWKWRTPDNGWSLKDLAVIRFYKSEFLIARYGVHTTQYSVSPLPGVYSVSASILTGVLCPPGYWMSIHFAEGVCGVVVGDQLPT